MTMLRLMHLNSNDSCIYFPMKQNQNMTNQGGVQPGSKPQNYACVVHDTRGFSIISIKTKISSGAYDDTPIIDQSPVVSRANTRSQNLARSRGKLKKKSSTKLSSYILFSFHNILYFHSLSDRTWASTQFP